MFVYSVKVFIVMLVALVSSEEEKRSRQGRIFSFDPDGEDIEVGLDFSIPFLKIPIKKTFNAVTQFGFPGLGLSKININPMALVLGAMFIAFLSVVAPFVNKAFALHHFPDRFSRLADTEELNNSATFSITEQLLANSGGCPERVACWASQRTKNPEFMDTWKQIMSNNLLSSVLNTTALKEATMKGRKGQNCEIYSPCPITEDVLPKLGPHVPPRHPGRGILLTPLLGWNTKRGHPGSRTAQINGANFNNCQL